MMIPLDLGETAAVVELGAGTGVVTRTLRQKLPPHTGLIAIEMQAVSVRKLRQRLDHVHIVCDSAEHLRRHLDRVDHRHADCIVSGLPWASMSGDLKYRILDVVLVSLKPGGVFTAMACVHDFGLTSTHKFKNKLVQRFRHVSASPIVWANLPPAFVYYCH